MERARILVVDDEDTIRLVLKKLLESQGHEVQAADSVESALELLAGPVFAMALLDVVLPGANGFELLCRLKLRCPDTQVVMMTSHASTQSAVEALRKGAYDYIYKPFEIADVVTVVDRALDRNRLLLLNNCLVAEQARQNDELRDAVSRLRSLNAAGIAMSGTTTLSELLDVFVGLVHDVLDVERVSLMLADDGVEELRIAAACGLAADVVRNTRVRLGEGIAGIVARDGCTLISADGGNPATVTPGGWPGAVGGYISLPVTLSVPIRTPQDVLGVLNVTSRRNGRAFDQDDVSYLSALAGQAAVAIERARHSDSLVAANESLRAAQEQLVSTGRIKALGEMAAGVAHDFNNVLNGILGRSQLILRDLRRDPIEPERIARSASVIEQLSQQGSETVRRIQEFTLIRRDRPVSVTDLNRVATLAVRLTEPKWRDESRSRSLGVHIEAELGEVRPIVGTLQELSQAVSNLIFNSVEAMPAGGRVTVRTFTRGEHAVIEVEDNGTGMSSETRQRLFDPFYTTKAQGQGLGMSVVYGIVNRLGGTVEVDSAPGCGSRVRLVFPVSDACATAVQDSDACAVEVPDCATAAPKGRLGRVLVIDDEAHNREICAEFLAVAGHTVDTAASGTEALARLGSGTYDVVITDLCMLGLSGWDVARGVKATSPGTRVMLLSGWGIQQDEDHAHSAGVDLVMSKPADMDALLDSVQRLLSA